MNPFSRTRFLVVGAGCFGATIAERIAGDLRQPVTVIDRRPHIGGNAHSVTDRRTGIEYHVYGTHIFHTSRPEVWHYLNRFTTFNGYRHQVLSSYRGNVYQMPINLETINAFFGLSLKPYQVPDFLRRIVPAVYRRVRPRTVEEAAIASVGKKLYEAFIKGYTEKQWGLPPSRLPASILRRLPVRANYNENYFFDQWQGIPTDGYTAVFERMLSDPRITVFLNADFFDIRHLLPAGCCIIYTGPIDTLCGYRFGRLAWRSLRFESEVVPVEDFQGTSVMNIPEKKFPYIRVHEPRHLHEERRYTRAKTLIIREYPCPGGAEDGFYPVNTPENGRLYRRYAALARRLKRTLIGGRLGSYRYYDMDDTIAAALELYRRRIRPRTRRP